MKHLRIIALIAIVAGMSACTDPDTTKRVLEENGYTDIQTGGYAAWSCGQDDSYATEFTATSPNGRRVHGAVCSALMKGATIRFF